MPVPTKTPSQKAAIPTSVTSILDHKNDSESLNIIWGECILSKSSTRQRTKFDFLGSW